MKYQGEDVMMLAPLIQEVSRRYDEQHHLNTEFTDLTKDIKILDIGLMKISINQKSIASMYVDHYIHSLSFLSSHETWPFCHCGLNIFSNSSQQHT